MTDKIVPSRAVTHAGKFHADDVFSTALLRILNPSIEIVRVQRIPEGYHWFAYDIGWGEFDHHQQNAPVRENGVPYAAFGLLWRTFGPQVLSGRDVEAFDKHFVQPLDLDDNTCCGDPIAEIIGNFNPAWDSSEPEDACFWQAVDFAQVILEKRFAAVRAICRAKRWSRRQSPRQRTGSSSAAVCTLEISGLPDGCRLCGLSVPAGRFQRAGRPRR